MMKPQVLALATLKPAEKERELHALYDVLTDPAAATGAEIVVTSGAVGITAAQIASLPALKLIAVNGVGVDAVDLAAAAARGIRVTNTPDVLSHSVAELALALALSTGRRLAEGDAFLRHGDWAAGGKLPLGGSVLTRRAGILGYGRIGRLLAGLLRGLGMQVHYTARSAKADSPDTFHPDAVALAGACDILFVTAAGGAETQHLVDAAVLDALGPQGILINVARGSVVDEDALIAALHAGRIGGAGLDVFADEPRVPQALIDAPNCTLTPHIGSATAQARAAMAQLVLDNIAAFRMGAPLPTQYKD